jgi:hypothetical protein
MKARKIMRKTSLKTRLNVTNDMMSQIHLINIGVIPDGFWSDEKEKNTVNYFINLLKNSPEYK